MNQVYFQSVTEAYEKSQEAIYSYLNEIEEGLRLHEEAATQKGEFDWAQVGDLTSLEATLKDLAERLHRRGEYAGVSRVMKFYDTTGQAVKVSTPVSD